MPYRVVSPDRKLYLVDSEDDLKAVGERYKLTSKQIGNIRQLLGWAGVGNHRQNAAALRAAGAPGLLSQASSAGSTQRNIGVVCTTKSD